jgi:outer membrane protein TolC
MTAAIHFHPLRKSTLVMKNSNQQFKIPFTIRQAITPMRTVVFLLLIGTGAWAQNVDYNRIILPESVQTSDFAEKLVQLAWRNHPSNEVFRRNVYIAEYGVKRSAGSWADIFHVQGNLNEFNLNPARDIYGRATFFPKYNVGAHVSLGMFLNIPYQTKQDRQRVLIAQAQLNEQKLEMRNVVLKAYNQFLLREKVYKIQARLLADIENNHKLIEQKFRNGETTFEAYSASQNSFNSASISLLQAEHDYKNAKLDVEKLIGMKLEDVH